LGSRHWLAQRPAQVIAVSASSVVLLLDVALLAVLAVLLLKMQDGPGKRDSPEPYAEQMRLPPRQSRPVT